MLAYHNNEELKQATILAMKEDIAAQRLIPGQYWENNKGCFVGCVVRGDDHMKFETQIGFPVMLARLADRVFEGLPTQAKRDDFAIRYLQSPAAGADLKLVGWNFLHWLLTEELPKSVVGEGKIFDDVRNSMVQAADVLLPLTMGKEVDKNAADAAAGRAADAAYYAADAAAYAAYAADAADAAYYAAAYERMALKLVELLAEAHVKID